MPPIVAEAMQAACAARGLAMRQPVRVQPMQRFDGGYTAGVGSVSWQERYAETWRSGWCALGIYCAPPRDAAGEEAHAPQSPLAGPAGLYDFEKNTLFVRMAGLAPSTIAHETVHALQYQNFPALYAAHPWDNRDLAAATASVVEGDAHVVGTSFDPAVARYWCSMDPRHVDASFAGWRGWRPDSFWAHEGFAHVYGPPRLLRRWLDDGRAGANRLLASPPLSTLAVLLPESAGPVSFTRLPSLLTTKLRRRGCQQGLVNTAGVVGVWGLLLLHGDDQARAEQLPGFLRQWSGDRFRHVACPGAGDDEFAWLTRWRTDAAAQEFATRLRGIAGKAADYGDVLSTPLAPVVRGNVVMATTGGMESAPSTLADAETRQFANYREWLESGCFPNDSCYEAAPEEGRAEETAEEFACQTTPSAQTPLAVWLERVRQARRNAPATPATIDALLADSARLASFCTLNGTRNSDLADACRAVVAGIAHWSTWQRDPHWRLLPHCGNAEELRAWLRNTYHEDAERPFVRASTFASIYGAALTAGTFASSGSAGLRELLASPPLSTRHYLAPAAQPGVAFLRLPAEELAARGCAVVASDVLGARWLWNLLLDYGRPKADDAAPDWLGHWRGDRQAYLRCADGEGWMWASRWQSEAAARAFASRYEALADHTRETGLPARPVKVRGTTAWLLPTALQFVEQALMEGLRIKQFDSFHDWKAGGCFPQAACNLASPKPAPPPAPAPTG